MPLLICSTRLYKLTYRKNLLMRNLFLSLFVVTLTYSASAQEIATTNADNLQKAEQLINGYQFAEALKFLDPNDSLDLNTVQRRAYCFLRLGNYLSAIR